VDQPRAHAETRLVTCAVHRGIAPQIVRHPLPLAGHIACAYRRTTVSPSLDGREVQFRSPPPQQRKISNERFVWRNHSPSHSFPLSEALLVCRRRTLVEMNFVQAAVAALTLYPEPFAYLFSLFSPQHVHSRRHDKLPDRLSQFDGPLSRTEIA